MVKLGHPLLTPTKVSGDNTQRGGRNLLPVGMLTPFTQFDVGSDEEDMFNPQTIQRPNTRPCPGPTGMQLKSGQLECAKVKHSIKVSKKDLVDMIPLLPKNAPPYLLLESLVFMVIQLYEEDNDKRHDLFMSVCSVLEECGFIGSSYKITQSRSLHQIFGSSLNRLILEIKSCRDPKLAATDLAQSSRSLLPTVRTHQHRLLHSSRSVDYLQSSRYQQTFTANKLIDIGGFGQVFSVRHSLDKVEYAVKVISFFVRTEKDYLKILREVELYARLPNHKHVVTYKDAWLEPDFDNPFGIVTESTEAVAGSGPKGIIECPTDSSSSIVFEGSGGPKIVATSPKVKITEVSVSSEETEEEKVAFQIGGLSVNRRVRTESNISASDSAIDYGVVRVAKDLETSFNHEKSKDSKLVAVSRLPRFGRGQMKVNLFIQMELCGQNLKDWIIERNSEIFKDSPPMTSVGRPLSFEDIFAALNIFKQILKGVHFLHTRNPPLIHRDLKPQNIFFDLSGQSVKIGDFGLATLHDDSIEVRSPVKNGRLKSSSTIEHTIGMGTTLYAAPEQKESGLYDIKADIYSLGVILFELLNPFNTSMEREKSVVDLKQLRRLPENFVKSFPEASSIIMSLTDSNPSKRPFAEDILKCKIFPSKDSRISDLEAEIKRLRDENRKLKELLIVNNISW